MKKYEKGSLMIEILAVLALISLITPMLFRQVSRRNEEVTRINVATEMRSIKDAMSAYIQTYELELSKDLGLMDANEKYTSIKSSDAKQDKMSESQRGHFANFLVGNSALDFLNDYHLYFSGYTVPTYTGSSGSALQPITGDMYRPVIVGVVVQKESSGKLSTASRIASLIGTEGGVVESKGGKLMGIGGTWSMEIDGFEQYAVGAVTAFDADSNSKLLDNLKIKDFHGDTASATYMAAQGFHATHFLSVGTDPEGTSCLINPGESGMEVVGSWQDLKDGSSEKCKPLFEVNGTTGEVFIAGAIRAKEEVPDSLKEPPKDKDGNVIDIPCSDALPCPAGLVCENSQCVYSHYSLDPAYTSVMNDIKVMSRGGARLSEILPDYISREIKVVESGSGETIDAPKCPKGYIQAITVQPTSRELGQLRGVVQDGEKNVTGLIKDDRMVIKIQPKGISADPDIDGFWGDTNNQGLVGWIVSAEVSTITTDAGGNVDSSVTTEINADLLVHTYCVFDSGKFEIPDKNRTE